MLRGVNPVAAQCLVKQERNMPDPQCNADTNQAESGAEMKAQSLLKVLERPRLAADSRQLDGMAHKNAIRGRPSTSSGAEISIRISCCVMCTQNSCSPSSWSGESSAMTSEIQPRANQNIGQSNDRRRVVRRNILVMPMP